MGALFSSAARNTAHLPSAQHLPRWVAVGPYAVLFLGLLLRWALLPDARFTGDEALFFRTTQDAASGDHWPALGPPVSGTEARHPGAGFYYLMSIPALVSSNPIVPGAFVALLSVLALSLLVHFARTTRGEAAAWIAAALGATSPWLILYADRIWNSNVAPWIALVVFYGAWRMTVVPRSRWVAAVVAGLMVLFQFHLSAPVLWVAIAAVLATARPRVSWRAASLGLALGVVAYLPYLGWELGHDFANTKAILSRGTGGAADAPQVIPALLYLYLFGTSEISYHLHTGYWNSYSPAWSLFSAEGWADGLAQYGPWLLGGVVASLAAAAAGWVAGIGRLARHLLRAPRTADPVYVALVAGGAAGVGLLVASDKPVYPHYVNLLLPIAFFPLVDGVLLLRRALPFPRLHRGAQIVGCFAHRAGRVGRWGKERHPLERRHGRAMSSIQWVGSDDATPPESARECRNHPTIWGWVLGLTTGAMALCFALTARTYYRRVDAPVGVATSVAIVETIAEASGGRPFSLQFRTFPNRFALSVLASHAARVPWPFDAKAQLRYEISARHGEEPPPVKGWDRIFAAGDAWIVERGR